MSSLVKGRGACRQKNQPPISGTIANYMADASKIVCCAFVLRQGGKSLSPFPREGIAPSTCPEFVM